MLADVINQFHFIEPLWLLGLIPAALILWQVFKHRSASNSAWKKVIDAKFLPFLLIKQGTGSKIRFPISLLVIGWVLAILALANPSWQRLPQAIFQQLDAQVIILDLSPSMMAKDLKPSRLMQARYKIEDILRQSQGKQTGLIAYAGDAFTVTPLTDDIATLKSHLRVLEPSLMPTSGNRPDLALQQAGQLLRQAGYHQGHIMLLTDSAGSSKTITAAEKLAKAGYQISVLGIGTAVGAPVPGARSRNGKPVLSKIDNAALQKVAKAGNGVYAAYTSNQQDINRVLQATRTSALGTYQGKKKEKQAERWVQKGPWLAVLLLPLALLAFRRGWFLALSFILLGQLLNPQPAMAFGWNDLWQRSDQQASDAFQKKDYVNAANISPDADLRGAAEYRAGNFKQAAESFSQNKDASSAYNLGNSLAHLGDYKKSIDAYDKALKQQPQMKDAIENRKLVAELLKKQQQKNKNQNKEQKKKSASQTKNDQKGNQKNNQKNNGKGKQGEKNSQSAKPNQQGKNKQNAKNQKQKNANSKKTSGKNAAKKENNFSSAGNKEQQKQANETVKKAAQEKTRKNNETLKQAKSNNKKPANSNATQASLSSDKLTPEQRQSVENWLRRVPDDPGGLLRRKFLYQYQQRQQQQ